MVDRYRNYKPYSPRAKQTRSNRRGVLFIGALVVIAFGSTQLVRAILDGASADTSAPASNVTSKKEVVKAEPIASNTWNSLQQQINAIIAANPDLNISVTVIDINSKTKGNYGIQDNFAGASTTKVLTAVAYLDKIENGTATLNTPVGGIAAQQQIRQMINRSNNESWAALNAAVGPRNLESYARQIGLSSYTYNRNLMTAGDEAVLLQKLYGGELINEEHKKLLLSYMQNTNNEDMIPKAAPAGAQLYHKYGQLEDRLHDAAIIDYQDTPIALVVYTKGRADTSGTEYANRTQLIQSIAQTVFDTIYSRS